MTYRSLTSDPAEDRRIVAVGLLTRRDLALLGDRFDRLYPVQAGDEEDFAGLLEAIDAAERRRRAPTD